MQVVIDRSQIYISTSETSQRSDLYTSLRYIGHWYVRYKFIFNSIVIVPIRKNCRYIKAEKVLFSLAETLLIHTARHVFLIV